MDKKQPDTGAWPLLFPYTFISGKVAEIYLGFFDGIKIFLPRSHNIPESLQRLEERGEALLLKPLENSTDEKLLEKSIKNAKQWALSREGIDRELIKLSADKVPFYNDEVITKIQSDLKSTGKNAPKEKNSLENQIFLCLAMESDKENAEAGKLLQNVEKMQARMVRELSGDNPETCDGEVFSEKTFEEMPAKRLEAWAGAFGKSIGEHSLLITSSKQVLDILDENAELKKIFEKPLSLPENQKEKEAFLKGMDGLLKTGELDFPEGLPENPDGRSFLTGIYSCMRPGPFKKVNRESENDYIDNGRVYLVCIEI